MCDSAIFSKSSSAHLCALRRARAKANRLRRSNPALRIPTSDWLESHALSAFLSACERELDDARAPSLVPLTTMHWHPRRPYSDLACGNSTTHMLRRGCFSQAPILSRYGPRSDCASVSQSASAATRLISFESRSYSILHSARRPLDPSIFSPEVRHMGSGWTYGGTVTKPSYIIRLRRMPWVCVGTLPFRIVFHSPILRLGILLQPLMHRYGS